MAKDKNKKQIYNILEHPFESQTELLKALRLTRKFDFLEMILHQTALVVIKIKVELKLNEAKLKNKNANYSEQEKMIVVLSDATEWMSDLQMKYENNLVEYHRIKSAMSDLHWLNQVLEQKNEALEKQIKINEKINNL